MPLESDVLPAKKRSAKVLVAEDNGVNRLVIRTLLAKLAHFDLTVDIVEDGQQALDYVMQAGPADVVLMDVQMPVMDGLLATKKIRVWEASQGQAHLPIIALTANVYEQDRQNCLAAGMDDFLAKPLDIQKLEAMLLRYVA